MKLVNVLGGELFTDAENVVMVQSAQDKDAPLLGLCQILFTFGAGKAPFKGSAASVWEARELEVNMNRQLAFDQALAVAREGKK